jgi:hypothetical protein
VTTSARDSRVRFALRTQQLLDDLIAFVESAGLGFVRHQNLFSSRMPDQPDNVLVLYEYPGRPPEYSLSPSLTPFVRRPRIQVQCRAKSYRLARTNIEKVYNLMSGVANQFFGSTQYMSITPLDEPGLMTRDTNRRTILVFNSEIEYVPTGN